MSEKPSYQELEKRLEELEEKTAELNRVEKALQESERLFRLLSEKSSLAYQSLDKKGHFLEVNQAWLDTLGYGREEVIGRSFGDFLPPEWLGHFKDNFFRFMAIGEILGVEFEMLKKDGSVITVFFNGRISRDEEGNFNQTHCVLHDISERKILEEENEKLTAELQEAQAEIERLMEIAPLCSQCGKRREDKEFWDRVEACLGRYGEAESGQGVCPDCRKSFQED